MLIVRLTQVRFTKLVECEPNIPSEFIIPGHTFVIIQYSKGFILVHRFDSPNFMNQFNEDQPRIGKGHGMPFECTPAQNDDKCNNEMIWQWVK